MGGFIKWSLTVRLDKGASYRTLVDAAEWFLCNLQFGHCLEVVRGAQCTAHSTLVGVAEWFLWDLGGDRCMYSAYIPWSVLQKVSLFWLRMVCSLRVWPGRTWLSPFTASTARCRLSFASGTFSSTTATAGEKLDSFSTKRYLQRKLKPHLTEKSEPITDEDVANSPLFTPRSGVKRSVFL